MCLREAKRVFRSRQELSGKLREAKYVIDEVTLKVVYPVGGSKTVAPRARR